MILYLVRHAHAVTETENIARPLSSRGRSEVVRLAHFLNHNGCFTPTQLWYSPLVRSRETAEQLFTQLPLEDSILVETPGLLPEDDPLQLAMRLAIYPKDRGGLALIGHEPHLSGLASLLLRGKATPELVKLRKAAVLALELTDSVHKQSGLERWRIRWQIAPELLPGATLPLP